MNIAACNRLIQSTRPTGLYDILYGGKPIFGYFMSKPDNHTIVWQRCEECLNIPIYIGLHCICLWAIISTVTSNGATTHPDQASAALERYKETKGINYYLHPVNCVPNGWIESCLNLQLNRGKKAIKGENRKAVLWERIRKMLFWEKDNFLGEREKDAFFKGCLFCT